MKPLAIIQHCPFCKCPLMDTRQDRDYTGGLYLLRCNQNCQNDYFDAITYGIENNLILLYLATPELQVSMYLNDPKTTIQDHKNYNHNKQILSLNHIVWFDLESSLNILKKIKFLLTFS